MLGKLTFPGVRGGLEWRLDAILARVLHGGMLGFLTYAEGWGFAFGWRGAFGETLVSAPDARGLFSDALGSAVDRRAYFFLFRQEKVAKKKATPAYAVGYADSLALLEAPGGCGTRLGCAKPQTVLADDPRPFSAAQRFRWGPGTASQFAGSTPDLSVPQLACLGLSESDVLPSPSASSSSAGGAGVVGLHCLSRRRVHASRPLRRAAQSTWRSRATKRARLLFGDFFLAKQEKATRRSTAKNSGSYGESPFLIGNQGALFAAWQPVGFSEPPGSAPDARAYFLLLRQNKVAKEKATPAYAVGYADSLALLEVPGGCGTRLGFAKPQTVLADYPRHFSAAQRFRWGPGTASQFAGSTSKNHSDDFDALIWPSRNLAVRAFQNQTLFPSPSASSSSAEYPAQPGDKAGSPFLCLLYFGEAKESKSPVSGEKQRQPRSNNSNPQYVRKPNINPSQKNTKMAYLSHSFRVSHPIVVSFSNI